MTLPSVSIILPTYNRLSYLREAVESVVAQTDTDWELIVIDDGSTDDTISWLQSLAEPRISVVPLAHTGHISRLRNAGLALARALWIAFLDSDDRWRPEKLERQRAYHAANPRFRWSYTRLEIIDADGHMRPATEFKPWNAQAGWILEHVLALDVAIGLPSVFIERALLEEVGGFDEQRWWTEDYDLWVRLASVTECGLVDEPLTAVRTHRSTSFDRAEVDEGFMAVYRNFAASTTNARLRDLATRREAYYAVWATNKWVTRREWRRALAAVRVALRRRPLAPSGYRAAARLVWHWAAPTTDS